jgi:4-amino-4-deoxy-L-arabinose transferase-like glycosyltransferase
VAGTVSRNGDVLRGRRLLLAATTLLALYLIVHLLLLGRFPWFVDETYYASLAQMGAAEPADRFNSLVDDKGLLVQWTAIALLHFDLAPMLVLRLISIVSGAVTALASGWIAWRWWANRTIAIVVVALTAFIPYLMVHDSVGIYDPVVAAGSMLALALELELARHQRLDLAMILGVVFGGLLLTKQTGVLALVMAPFSLVVFQWEPQRRWRRLGAWAGLIVLALVIALLLYSLRRLSPLAYVPGPHNHRTLSDFLHHPFQELSAVAGPVWRTLWCYLTPGGVLLGIWGMVRVVAERHRAGIVVALWAVAALVMFVFVTTTPYPRYGLQIAAPAALLAVIGGRDLVTRLLLRARSARSGAGLERRWFAAAGGLLALAVIPGVVIDVRILADPGNAPYAGLDRDQYNVLISNRAPARAAAQHILQLAPPAFTAATPLDQRTIATIGGWVWSTELTVNGNRYSPTPRFIVAPLGAPRPQLQTARFVIVEQKPPAWMNLRPAQLVGRWTRPGGPSVELYDRAS